MNLTKTKKKYWLFASFITLATFSFYSFTNDEDSTYRIKIKMEQVSPEKESAAYLIWKDNNIKHTDTAYLNENMEFVFEGKIPAVNRASLVLLHEKMDPGVDPKAGDRIFVYLEKGELLISGKDSLLTAKVSGTPANETRQMLIAIGKSYEGKIKTMNTAFAAAMEAKDQAKVDELTDEYNKLISEKISREKEFFLAHTNSDVSMDWLRGNINIIQDHNTAKELFNKLSDDIKKSPAGLIYAAILKQVKPADINCQAPDISAKQPSGESLSLRSLRGQYVLLNFWASWSDRCLRESPAMVKVYNEFKDKGFTILSYSLDGGNNALAKWTEAIEKNGLTWHHISDLAGQSSLATQLYGIKNVPTNFLIDPNGVIIAKNLHGDELEAKLKEVLK